MYKISYLNYFFRLSRSPIRDRRHYEHIRSSKTTYSRSRSHSPHQLKHDHVHIHHSPKRILKSPTHTTSKSLKQHTSHVPRVSPHNSHTSKKSSHVRQKYSRSPKNMNTLRSPSKSLSPVSVKDSRTTKKHSDSDSPGCYSSVSKRKKLTKSPAKQYNPKVRLSETSLFAELVRDRQMRELAMKCLTQANTKAVDENEIVEIHDDSENEQINHKLINSDSKLHSNNVGDDVNSCVIVEISENKIQTSKSEVGVSNVKSGTSSLANTVPKISVENLSPSISRVDIIENGIEHSLEQLEPNPKLLPKQTSPDNEMKSEVIESKDLTKMSLPLPPLYPEHDQISPDSEIKSSKRSIKDLPLPPGKLFTKFIYMSYYLNKSKT